jgi:UDP-N-acetylglucosamine 2-epimerase (non-hydrolysing)
MPSPDPDGTGAPATVLCIFGTRPDTIKMAPVVHALQQAPWCRLRVCVTAQHRHLLDPLLAFFNIRPDDDLDIMRENQSLADLTARLFAGIGGAIAAVQPAWVVVQGDTTTAFAAAMAAFYARARVAHVEAGLRTAARDSPFPEEINRRLIGQIADLHLAPTAGARDNLVAEGIDASRVVVTGNTGIDALRWAAEQPAGDEWSRLDPPAGTRLVLVTTHRRESFGAPLQQTCLGIRDVARAYGSRVRILLPVHPNPNVRPHDEALLGGEGNVVLTEPLSYPTLVHAMRRAHFVLTDSGGIQEEAPSLGCPVLVLRDNTERPEGVAAGVATLVGTSRERIVSEARRLLDDAAARDAMASRTDVYGDGRAAGRIVAAIAAATAAEARRTATV